MKNNPKIYLVCGSGGVGKTTISAALGLKFAAKGYKIIVLTIDPARRLATSLGISDLTDVPKQIDFTPDAKAGEMWAMMLNTKQTFDHIVEKYAPTQEAAQIILNNRIYQHMSNMMAGTQEYMAMEKMYDIYLQNKYDIIILDTPPMQNAIEFLVAPQKMMNMINDSMLQILLKPTLFVGKSGLKLLERGSRQIMKILDKIAGFAFIQELSEMFILFKDLLGGFQTRAAKVNQVLSDPSCNFVTVCTTTDNSVQEAQGFKEQLDLNHYYLDKIIVNRVYTAPGASYKNPGHYQDDLYQKIEKETADCLINNFRNYIPLIRQDRQVLNQLYLLIGKSNIVTVPLFLSDIHDLVGLQKVADNLSF